MTKQIDGYPVVNATEPTILKVSRYDCSHADRKAPQSCAIARACKRELHADEVRVHLGRVYVREGDKWVRYHTPSSLRLEIINFDRGGDFAPGEYTLGPIPPTKLKGGHQGGTDARKRLVKREAGHRVPGVRQASPLAPPATPQESIIAHLTKGAGKLSGFPGWAISVLARAHRIERDGPNWRLVR